MTVWTDCVVVKAVVVTVVRRVTVLVAVVVAVVVAVTVLAPRLVVVVRPVLVLVVVGPVTVTDDVVDVDEVLVVLDVPEVLTDPELTPMQEHADANLTAPEQAEAYVGTAVAAFERAKNVLQAWLADESLVLGLIARRHRSALHAVVARFCSILAASIGVVSSRIAQSDAGLTMLEKKEDNIVPLLTTD